MSDRKTLWHPLFHRRFRHFTRWLAVVAGAAAYVGAMPLAHAYDPTAFMQLHVPSAKVNGNAELRHYGKPVYDATLYANPNSFSPDDLTREPFAIDLAYEKPCTGHTVASNVVSSMRDMGGGSSAQLKDWNAQLTHLLPDFAIHDHLTAVYLPGQGTGFFRNGVQVGSVSGNGFARAFFGIWLNTKSTMPGVRQGLLNGSS